MMRIAKVPFARPSSSYLFSAQVEYELPNLSRTGRKLLRKIKAHAQTDAHLQASKAILSAAREGSIVQQLQSIGVQERAKTELL